MTDLAADWQEYEARYAIYRNGKLAAKAEFSLQRLTQGQWVMKTESSGTHGLARLLRLKDTESVEGQLDDGRFRPRLFTHHTRVAGIDNIWQASFDWLNRSVVVMQGDEETKMPLAEDALDGLSLKLEMQRRLREDEDNLTFYLLDEDEISEQKFRLLQPEQLETSLGCLETLPVERVRENSSRYTRAWHAPELEYITVRMEHGKKGGDHMEMRITSLTLGDKSVKPGIGCVSRQTSP